jgi:tRNA-specific 2-thiouridylase
VAMSGGVDSSVAACLLREQGYDVIGLFMRVGTHAPADDAATPAWRSHQGCCSAGDAADARLVAGKLNIPFYALNFERDFKGIIDYFVDEYRSGRTPNPCVVCNSSLKFGRLLEYADAVGADFIATGHYARIETRDGRRRLCQGVDRRKDQSYVLFGLDRTVLDRALLPVGGMTKDQVRQKAARLGLPVCEKPDSVEICFVPDRDYARLVRQRRPEAFRPGDVLDQQGNVLGRHQGIAHFTIGQRRGLGIAVGHPVYVTRLNVLDNTVTLGARDALLRRSFQVRRLNLLDQPPSPKFRARVRIRYHHQAAPATIELQHDDCAAVTFDEPQSAVTPGQASVFYDGDAVIGGGWIEG